MIPEIDATVTVSKGDPHYVAILRLVATGTTDSKLVNSTVSIVIQPEVLRLTRAVANMEKSLSV